VYLSKINFVKMSAEYLEKHNIHAIFNEVIEELSTKQPENPVQFSVNYLIDKYLNLSLLQTRKGLHTPGGSNPGSPRIGELHIHETNALTQENLAPELATSNTDILANKLIYPQQDTPIRRILIHQRQLPLLLRRNLVQFVYLNEEEPFVLNQLLMKMNQLRDL
jgi:hypothetical protein